MKRYREELVVDVSADVAWQALTEMRVWLEKLSTNKEVRYEDNGLPFCHTGRTYEVITKEGVSMKTKLCNVDAAARKIEIRAEHKPLVSLLCCEVEELDAARVKLMRTQAYPGLVGALFTLLYNRREAGEVSEYLSVWADHARTLMS